MAASILTRVSESNQPPVLPSPLPKPAAVESKSFWQEFLRVECDKFLLLVLIVFLWKVGQFEMMKYVVGGLIVAINHNRFRWN